MTATQKEMIRPVGARLLVKAHTVESKKPSAILLPESATTKAATIYRVEAIGDGFSKGTKMEAPCAVGDLVVIERYAGHDVPSEDDENKLKIVGFDDIIAIYNV